MSRETPAQWLDADEQRAWRQYLHASRLLEAVMDRDLQSYRLQLPEYEVIAVLSEAPDRRLRMSAIADMIVQSRSRLTHTAGRLEKRGWVRRETCVGDRRGVELVLTDAGQAAVIKMAPTHVRSVRHNLVDPLSREEFLALGRTMGAVGRGIENNEAVAGFSMPRSGPPEAPGGEADELISRVLRSRSAVPGRLRAPSP
jgi:DNA-binding MarR family transcriptional regulator